MQARRNELFAGAASAVLGLATILLMHWQPQALRTPPWVAYVAASSFVLGGAAIMARATGRTRLARWLPVALVACLVTPAIWLALGAGPRRCVFSAIGSVGLRLLGRHAEWLCRFGFGVAALLGLAIVLLSVRHAIRMEREEPRCSD